MVSRCRRVVPPLRGPSSRPLTAQDARIARDWRVRGGLGRPGEFRTVQNYIGFDQAPIAEARFVPPPVADMREALARWERDLHRQPDPLPLLVRLAVAHYQFEAIHPFRDGNGRVGRLLIPLLLCERQRLTAPLLYMSAFFEHHREEYMDRLLRVSTAGDWDGWVAFFLRGVLACAEENRVLTEGLLALRDRYHEAVRPARSSGVPRQGDSRIRRPRSHSAGARAMTTSAHERVDVGTPFR